MPPAALPGATLLKSVTNRSWVRRGSGKRELQPESFCGAFFKKRPAGGQTFAWSKWGIWQTDLGQFYDNLREWSHPEERGGRSFATWGPGDHPLAAGGFFWAL